MKKYLDKASRYLEDMQFADRMVKEYFDPGYCDLLLIGKDGRRELETIYKRSKTLGYKSIWGEWMDEPVFWNQLFTGISLNGKQLPLFPDKERAKSLGEYLKAEIERRNSTDPAFAHLTGNHYLFIPGIDKLLFRLDLAKGGPGGFSARLKHAHDISEGKLNILGSVADAKSEEYRQTLIPDSNYECAFSEDDFRIFEQADGIFPSHFIRESKYHFYDSDDANLLERETKGEILEKLANLVR